MRRDPCGMMFAHAKHMCEHIVRRCSRSQDAAHRDCQSCASRRTCSNLCGSSVLLNVDYFQQLSISSPATRPGPICRSRPTCHCVFGEGVFWIGRKCPSRASHEKGVGWGTVPMYELQADILVCWFELASSWKSFERAVKRDPCTRRCPPEGHADEDYAKGAPPSLAPSPAPRCLVTGVEYSSSRLLAPAKFGGNRAGIGQHRANFGEFWADVAIRATLGGI